MRSLTVLFTNWTLHGRHGSVLYLRDLALNLLRSGHRPIIYAPESGEIGRELVNGTVPVITEIDRLADPPDIIHTNSSPDGFVAMLQFPETPAVCTSHAWNHQLTEPIRLRRVRRYLAVDDTCRDDLIVRHGIPSKRVEVHRNGVDLQRFRPRKPLPERLQKALIFSNYAAVDGYARAVQAGCDAGGFSLTIIGDGAGTGTTTPETVLPEYDIVFAKGRAATEAAAVGCAVILCDSLGMGGLVTSKNWESLRRLNFGRRNLQYPVTAERIQECLREYDANDAAIVSSQLRNEADLQTARARLVATYEQVIAEHAADRRKNNPSAEIPELVQCLQQFLPHFAELLRGAGIDRRNLRVLQDQLAGGRSQPELPKEVMPEPDNQWSLVRELRLQLAEAKAKIAELHQPRRQFVGTLGRLMKRFRIRSNQG